jgi:outer membrane immunogenic protein
MRMYVRAFGLAVLLGPVTGAVAADIPSSPPAMIAAPPVVDWTGAYVGGLALYGSGHADFLNSNGVGGGYDLDGWGGGILAGFNQQIGSWVFGPEIDIGWSSYGGGTVVGGDAIEARAPWMATARVRLGYAFDRLLVYGTAGVVMTPNKASTASSGSDEQTHVGWTAGAGLDYAITDHWIAGASYLYVDPGTRTYNYRYLGVTPFTAQGSGTANVFRASLSYKF